VALCQARISTKPLWGFSSSNPYHSQSRAEQFLFTLMFVFFAPKENLYKKRIIHKVLHAQNA
jgi:hypothetical protein